MKVLVDTSVWSLALRRRAQNLNGDEIKCLNELKELINEVRIRIIGPVRQELLSGIPDPDDFELLKERLSNFKDSDISVQDYELAAEFYNRCRKKGVQGSHIDFLICAFSFNNRCPIFTLDKDFELYKKYCSISLHKSRF